MKIWLIISWLSACIIFSEPAWSKPFRGREISKEQRMFHHVVEWIKRGTAIYPTIREIKRTLLHGREETEGGNLLHYLTRNMDFKPLLVKNMIENWTHDTIPRRALSKALKHRDNEGLTPKELAEKLQNETAFKALSLAEDSLKKRTNAVKLLTTLSAYCLISFKK